jgi:hypothetical protein
MGPASFETPPASKAPIWIDVIPQRGPQPIKESMVKADAMGRGLPAMSTETIVIIVVLVILFGGGGGYWFSRRR